MQQIPRETLQHLVLPTTVSMASQTIEGLPYVPLVAYNGTVPTGGNSLTEDLNIYYQSGDIAW